MGQSNTVLHRSMHEPSCPPINPGPRGQSGPVGPPAIRGDSIERKFIIDINGTPIQMYAIFVLRTYRALT